MEEMWKVEDNDDGRGRRLIAKQRILQGTVVLEEEVTAGVVSWRYQLAACQHCYSAIHGEQAYAHNNTDPYRYCSEECLRADAPVHVVEMECVNRLKKMKGLKSPESDEGQREREIEPFRLIIRAAAQKKLNASSSSSEAERVPLVGKSNRFQHLLGLEAHENIYTGDELDYVNDMGRRIEILLRVCGMVMKKEEVVHLIKAITSNAHSIKGPVNVSQDFLTREEEVVGLGLFPMTSMINHACQANCVHYFLTGKKRSPKLVMRAIKDIEEGEELMYSYVMLYNSTVTRRKNLLRTYQFECVCPRCLRNISSASPSEAGEYCNDQVIGDELSDDPLSPGQRLMSMMGKGSVFLKQMKLPPLIDTVQRMAELLEGKLSTGEISPLSLVAWFVYNAILTMTTKMLHAPLPSLLQAPNADIRNELLKLSIRFGLLALGAIRTFIPEPMVETATILLSIHKSLAAITASNEEDAVMRVPLDSGTASSLDAVRRVYVATGDTKGDATVFTAMDNSTSGVESVLTAAVRGLDGALSSDTPTMDAAQMLKSVFKTEGLRILAICRGPDSST